MRRDRLDVSGMIRALEDYLAATRPPEPPAPPRAKSGQESKLETLLEELSRPLPPEPVKQQTPEPVPGEPIPAAESAVDVQLEPEAETEVAPILMDDVAVAKESVVKDNIDQTEHLVAENPEDVGDEVPAAPPPVEAPPIHPRDPEPKSRPARAPLFVVLLVLAVGPIIMRRRPAEIAVKKEVVAAKPPAPVSVAHAPAPLTADPQSRAIDLVLSYRPSGGPVTTGEIFRSIAGDPIPDENWEIRLGDGGRFLIRFVPYRGALGENYSYDFEVDARANRVRPRPDTNERLRVDALGRLAGRSDLQAFWQFLDLRR